MFSRNATVICESIGAVEDLSNIAAMIRCPMGMKTNSAASAAQLVIRWLLAS
jgi:hypothetical protein